MPRAQYLHGTALTVADHPEGAALLHEAMTAARAAGDMSTEFFAANNLVSHHESAGDPAAGRATCEDVIARARALGLGEWEHGFAVVLTTLEFHAGEYARVLAVANDLLERVREKRAHDIILETLCITLLDVGRIDSARRLGAAEAFTDDYKGRTAAAWIDAEAALWGGRPARTLEVADRMLAHPENDPNVEFFRVARAWACCDLGIDPGPAAPDHPYTMLKAVRPETEGVRRLVAGADAREPFATAAAAVGAVPPARRAAVPVGPRRGDAARGRHRAGGRDPRGRRTPYRRARNAAAARPGAPLAARCRGAPLGTAHPRPR